MAKPPMYGRLTSDLLSSLYWAHEDFKDGVIRKAGTSDLASLQRLIRRIEDELRNR